MPLLPELLRANAEVADRLDSVFELRLEVDPTEPVWFSVDGAKGFAQFGRDGAGGVFAQLVDSRCILYASSEGSAGVIAADFDEFVNLIVACPYWRDILKFSARGNLEEMRRSAAWFEAESLDDEDLEEARDFPKSELGLTEPADPVGALHRAASSTEVIIRTQDGKPCMSLFNRFTIDDNPMFRYSGN